MHGINSRPTLLRLRAVCAATARLLSYYPKQFGLCKIELDTSSVCLRKRLDLLISYSVYQFIYIYIYDVHSTVCRSVGK